jgi:hypothetical protein
VSHLIVVITDQDAIWHDRALAGARRGAARSTGGYTPRAGVSMRGELTRCAAQVRDVRDRMWGSPVIMGRRGA